jgi:hypothetical protein
MADQGGFLAEVVFPLRVVSVGGGRKLLVPKISEPRKGITSVRQVLHECVIKSGALQLASRSQSGLIPPDAHSKASPLTRGDRPGNGSSMLDLTWARRAPKEGTKFRVGHTEDIG